MPIVNLRGTLEAEAAQTPLSTLMSIIGAKPTSRLISAMSANDP